MSINILLTGSSGFIGKNISENLGQRYKILSPSHKKLDLTDENQTSKYFKNNHIDVVIHCALEGGSRPEEHTKDMFYNNLKMFMNITRNKNYYKRLIFIGSGAEYDKRNPIKNVKEEDFDKRLPVDDYGFYKYICSKLIGNSENIINLRLFGLFGKYEDYQYRFISYAICKNILGFPIDIKQNVLFDYIYINDFIKILDYFIKNKPKHKFYNVGSGKKVDLITLSKKINDISNNKSKIIIEKNGHSNEYTCDNTRLLEELKGFRFTSLDDSINDLFKWYKNNINRLKVKFT